MLELPSKSSNPLEGRGSALRSFPLHGVCECRVPLCCRRLNGAKTENCSPEVFKPESLGIFQTALMYFLRISLPTVQPDMMYIFWGHEWSK